MRSWSSGGSWELLSWSAAAGDDLSTEDKMFVSQFYSGLVSLDITAEVNSVNNSTASLYHLIDLLKLWVVYWALNPLRDFEDSQESLRRSASRGRRRPEEQPVLQSWERKMRCEDMRTCCYLQFTSAEFNTDYCFQKQDADGSEN